MPSSSLQIAVRVKDDLYEMIRRAADAEGRSMSNYVDRVLRTFMTPDGKIKSAEEIKVIQAGHQVDLEEAIAQAGTRLPAPRSKSSHVTRRPKPAKGK